MTKLVTSLAKGSRRRGAAWLVALALVPLMLAGPVSAQNRPGTGRIPAFVCLKTTITDQGHTRQSTLIRKSGNPGADRGALRLARTLRFLDEEGPHVEREMYILMRMHGTGFAFRFFELYEPLPDVCSTPAPDWRRKK